MPKIRVLPEILANQIAAGEIVERPASVVKELIENSLDAGARSITVEVAHGGRRILRVRDDGEGMGHDDAILAFEHHATSKLRESEDLRSIRTLGFRGEALPSIASVSRLTLRTIEAARVDPSSNLGTEVVIYGGTVKSVKSIPWSVGTEVTVQDLFFNLPARKKFLKSNETELGHVTRLVLHYAMANPGLACAFVHDGRPVFEHVATSSLDERLYQILGQDLIANLVPFDGAAEGHRVRGVISRPHEHRANANSQYFYVNGRMVRDRLVTHAVHQAFGSALPKGMYPVVVLFVELDPEEVDVNVHPAKTEVRFRNQSLLHDLIRTVIEKALLRAQPVPRFEYPRDELGRSRPSGSETDGSGFQRGPDVEPGRLSFERAPIGFSPNQSLPSAAFSTSTEIPVENTVLHNSYNRLDSNILQVTSDCGKLPILDENNFNRQAINNYETRKLDYRIVGQLDNTFILAADEQGLILIDQHVAHERVLFEQFLAEIQGRKVATQRLLLPLTFDLGAEQRVAFDTVRAELESSGFEIEEFGGATLIVKAVPAMVSQEQARVLVLEILDRWEEDSRGHRLVDLQRTIAAGMACKAAVKANDPLSLEKMSWLIERLSQTEFPHACPHGRPIQVRISLTEIGRRFQRI